MTRRVPCLCCLRPELRVGRILAGVMRLPRVGSGDEARVEAGCGSGRHFKAFTCPSDS